MQKTAPKNTKYSRNESIFKIGHHCKGSKNTNYCPCKILTLGQKLKFQKTFQNPLYKWFRVVLCKKPLQKTPNIREIKAFWKSFVIQSLKPMQNADCGWKIKFQKACQNPFYKSFRVFLCKKPLQKPPNIREIRAFWKSAIIAKAIAHAKSLLWVKN